MTVMYDFNPVIFEKRRSSARIPWHRLGRLFKRTVLVKLGVGQRYIKRIFFRSKATRQVTAAAVGVVDSAKVGEPSVVPEALMIRYEVV